jgi:hypothetical protein
MRLKEQLKILQMSLKQILKIMPPLKHLRELTQQKFHILHLPLNSIELKTL